MGTFHVASQCVKFVRLLLVGLCVWSLAESKTPAADLYWSGATGDWSVADNWGGTLPSSGDVVHAVTGGTVYITQPDATCNFLYLGIDEGSSGTVEMTDGTLAVLGRTCVGNGGVGTFTQTGGIHSAGSMDVGYGDGSNGTYTLGGGQLIVSADENIGITADAMGRFQQTGGTHTVNKLSIGPGGTYLLSGGTLEITGSFQNAGVVDGGNGSAMINALNAMIMDFSSGQFVNATSLTLSLPAGSLAIVREGFDPATVFGTYSNAGLTHVLGTTLNLTSDQSFGGSATVVDRVICAGNITTNGEINLNGGLSLSSGTVQLGQGNLITDGDWSNISGGTLAAATHYVGYAGAGTFTQTAGSHTPTHLYLGNSAGKTGTYLMSGGTLTSSSIQVVGGTGIGTFSQSGGTNKPATLLVGGAPGGTGTYELSGGTLTPSNLIVGSGGNGTFLHSGGSNSPSTLSVGGGAGNYTMNGTASLATNTMYLGGIGRGVFSHSAGTARINSTLFVAQTPGSEGTYNLSGTGTIVVRDEQIGIGGVGIFNHETGGNSASGTIQIGLNPTSSGTYNLTGAGYVSARQLVVGSGGTGTFSQSAGTVSIFGAQENYYLILGLSNPSARGTYNLSGTGSLAAQMETVGLEGVGVFNQSGGTNTVFSSLFIGQTASGGTYNLSGTGQLFAGYVSLGPGTATFNQTGGVHQVPGYLFLGGTETTPATYNLSGGTLSSAIFVAGYNGGSAVFVNSGGAHHVAMQFTMGDYGSAKTNIRYTLSGTGMLTVGASAGIVLGNTYPSRFEWFTDGLTVSRIALGRYGTLAIGFDCDLARLPNGSLYHGGAMTFTTGGVVEITNGAAASISTVVVPPVFPALVLGTATGGGSLNISGSASAGAIAVTIGAGGTGTVTQTGGIFSVTDASQGLTLGSAAGSQGIYHLNGGTLGVANIKAGQGAASFNFGGGTLQSLRAIATSLPMNLTGVGGSAKLDTTRGPVTLSGVLSGPGGLEKLGEGLLSLAARNSYGGDTVVRGGTLVIGNGIDPVGTKLIDVQGGLLSFYTVTVDKSDLAVNTATGTSFEIQGGNHILGLITGTGTTKIYAGSVTVGSLRQDALVVGLPSATQSVPEPGAVVLLLSSLVAVGAMRRALKRL
jgi:autotransporter-associated beta strand protein